MRLDKQRVRAFVPFAEGFPEGTMCNRRVRRGCGMFRARRGHFYSLSRSVEGSAREADAGSTPFLRGARILGLTLASIDAFCAPRQVETSNLHRQVMFREDNAGKSKAQCAARVARGINSTVRCAPLWHKVRGAVYPGNRFCVRESPRALPP